MKSVIPILLIIIAAASTSAGVKSPKPKLVDDSSLPDCSFQNLFDVAFRQGHPVERDCLYTMQESFSIPLKVLQVTDGGVLLVPMNEEKNPFDKVIFVKTKSSYVDGDVITDMSVKYSGIKSYLSAAGSNKTIHSFQQVILTDLKPNSENISKNQCNDQCYKNYSGIDQKSEIKECYSKCASDMSSDIKSKKQSKPANCQESCFKKSDDQKFKEGETLEKCLQTSCGH